jgi:hypothetical protein
MPLSRSPAKSGVYGLGKTPVATTTLSASKRRVPVLATYRPFSFVSASTAAPLRIGSSKRVAYASR